MFDNLSLVIASSYAGDVAYAKRVDNAPLEIADLLPNIETEIGIALSALAWS